MDGIPVAEMQDGTAHEHDILAVAGFIAERPKAHACVTAVAQNHAARTVYDCLAPGLRAAGHAFAAHAVTFHVALIHDIKTHLIAQVVKPRRIGIVTGADGVDICLLHQQQILIDPLFGNIPRRIRIEIVTVDALEYKTLIVEIQDVAADLYFFEADTDPFLL